MNAELVQYVLANSEANMLASHNCQLTRTYFSPNLDRQQVCRLAGGYKRIWSKIRLVNKTSMAS